MYQVITEGRENRIGAVAEETMRIATAAPIQQKFIKEVQRLLERGAVNLENHNRGLLYGVALANLADRYLRGEKKSKEYRNLIKF